MVLTYKGAGVDIEKGLEVVKRIKERAKETFGKEVLSEIGGFSGIFKPYLEGYKDPVLVASCDGVGTKLKVSSLLGRHDGVGVDLVAMCVNDIITTGARPLFLLDYIAMERLDVEVIEEIIKGIVNGCKEAGCALLGGETAEMPGMYKEGDYELVGFSVGIVEQESLIQGKAISQGDSIIGLSSSGLHSNGYSLVRKVLGDEISMYGDEVLRPTKIYVSSVLKLMDRFKIKGIAHITGGGLPENIIRILPEGRRAIIEKKRWRPHWIFHLIQEKGRIEEEEMYRTFNMGIGMVIVVEEEEALDCIGLLNQLGETPYLIGKIVDGERGVEIIG